MNLPCSAISCAAERNPDQAARASAPLKTAAIESASPFTPLGAKGMGEGGGGGIHAVCSAIQDALRPAGGAIVYDSCNPAQRVWQMLTDPEPTRANVEVVS